MDHAVVIDIDLVDQAELVDVGRNFRIIDSLDRTDDVVGQPSHFLGRNVGRPLRSICRRCRHRFSFDVFGFDFIAHEKKPCALIKACTRQSISSRVLYIANEARQVADTPKRDNSGITQWVPARTATPERSMMVATSCGCAPLISNETIGPLSLALPMMRNELISRSRSWA